MVWATPKTDWTAANGVADVDMIRIEENIRILSQYGGPYGPTTGGTTAYLVTASPPLTSLVTGGLVVVRINATNTGASTLNANGLGVKSLKKANGDAFDAGDLLIDAVYTFRYNGTDFILQGEGGGIVVNDAILGDYVIDTDQIITKGDLVYFASEKARYAVKNSVTVDSSPVIIRGGVASNTSIVALDADKALAFYSYNDGTTRVSTRVLSVSDTTITFGSELQYSTHSIGVAVTACRLSATRVLVVWTENSLGRAAVFTISGTTVSKGTTLDLAGRTDNPTISLVDTDKCLIAFRDGDASFIGQAMILTASGTTVTKGAKYTYIAVLTSDVNCVEVSTNKALIIFYASGLGGRAVIASVAGTVITFGTVLTFQTGSQFEQPSVTLVDTDKVVVYYESTSFARYSIVLTISGTTITAGTRALVGGFGSNIRVYKIDSRRVLFSHVISSIARCIVVTVNGTNMSMAAEYEVRTDMYASNALSAGQLVDTKFITLQVAGSNVETSIISTPVYPPEGLAMENGTAGQTKEFYDWR